MSGSKLADQLYVTFRPQFLLIPVFEFVFTRHAQLSVISIVLLGRFGFEHYWLLGDDQLSLICHGGDLCSELMQDKVTPGERLFYC